MRAQKTGTTSCPGSRNQTPGVALLLLLLGKVAWRVEPANQTEDGRWQVPSLCCTTAAIIGPPLARFGILLRLLGGSDFFHVEARNSDLL